MIPALLLVLLGTAFCVIGVIGLLRLPDPYTRLHATGKVGVFGVVLMAFGAAFVTGAGLPKVIVLAALLILTGPVVSHAISSAGLKTEVPLAAAVVNDLEPDKRA